MTTRKKKKKSPRPRGGQPGNKNALKHGFFSKQFTAEENKRLDAQEEADTASAIALLMVMIDRLAEQINFDEHTVTDANGNSLRDDHYLRQLHTLASMTQSQATLIRTQYLVKGKGGEIEKGILEALEEARIIMGI